MSVSLHLKYKGKILSRTPVLNSIKISNIAKENPDILLNDIVYNESIVLIIDRKKDKLVVREYLGNNITINGHNVFKGFVVNINEKICFNDMEFFFVKEVSEVQFSELKAVEATSDIAIEKFASKHNSRKKKIKILTMISGCFLTAFISLLWR